MKEKSGGYTREGLPRTQNVDGKQYRFHDSYLRRSDATWNANKLRSNGWYVRTYKILGLYVLYKRKKSS
jgi:hypothetical protein